VLCSHNARNKEKHEEEAARSKKRKTRTKKRSHHSIETYKYEFVCVVKKRSTTASTKKPKVVCE